MQGQLVRYMDDGHCVYGAFLTWYDLFQVKANGLPRWMASYHTNLYGLVWNLHVWPAITITIHWTNCHGLLDPQVIFPIANLLVLLVLLPTQTISRNNNQTILASPSSLKRLTDHATHTIHIYIQEKEWAYNTSQAWGSGWARVPF